MKIRIACLAVVLRRVVPFAQRFQHALGTFHRVSGGRATGRLVAEDTMDEDALTAAAGPDFLPWTPAERTAAT